MTGTLAGALAARDIPVSPEGFSSDAEGFIESVDGQMVITRIKVRYSLKVPKGKRKEAQRALDVHEQGCPVAQSLKRGIAVEWEGDIVEE